MWELLALAVYSVQWLGIVLGVGAEAVLLVAHLTALHQHKPDWHSNIPSVRMVQRVGLTLIILSGAVAVGFQALIDPSVFAIPVFGFKWALIALVWMLFLAVRLRLYPTWIEGLAGGTWLALFVVHSVAPVSLSYVELTVGFAWWLAIFGLLWAAAVEAMGHVAHIPSTHVAQPKSVENKTPLTPKPVTHAPQAKPAPVVSAMPKPAPVAPPPPPPAPKPVIPLAPKASVVVPVAAATPTHVEHKPVTPLKLAPAAPAIKPTAPAPVAPAVVADAKSRKPSLWKRFLLLFVPTPKVPEPIVAIATPEPPKKVPVAAPAPTMAAVSAPVRYDPPPIVPSKPAALTPAPAKPMAPPSAANLPVVEHLELMAPAAAPVAVASSPQTAEPVYVPDWDSIPGLRIMPQKPEDLPKQNRAPIVQAAA